MRIRPILLPMYFITFDTMVSNIPASPRTLKKMTAKVKRHAVFRTLFSPLSRYVFSVLRHSKKLIAAGPPSPADSAPARPRTIVAIVGRSIRIGGNAIFPRMISTTITRTRMKPTADNMNNISLFFFLVLEYCVAFKFDC